ncbi:MAG: repressor LexA [Clostridia bacterium]|jgi:repressor LexA|nr:repressor LexA [Clostridia bacterium]
MKPLKTEYFTLLEEAVNRYREETGVAPTILELVERTGIPQATISRYLRYMNEHGMIEYAGHRRIRTRAAAKQNDDTVLVPLLGSIACGAPLLAEENIEEYIRLPETLVGKGEFFLLRANGRSMIKAGIDDGDLVVIRQQDDAEPGQIVVALVDDDTATLKRYYPRRNSRVELVPENDEFRTQTIDLSVQHLSIQGVAVKVIKSLA